MKSAEEIVNRVHEEDSAKIRAEFKLWLDEIKERHIGCLMPELVIAEMCLDISNKRHNRRDKGEIVWTMKTKPCTNCEQEIPEKDNKCSLCGKHQGDDE